MKSLKTRTFVQGLLCGACLSLAAASQGATTSLFFRAAAVTNTMPDGRQVVMWGFAQEGSANSVTGVVQVPGPSITIPPGSDQDLAINLRNELPEAVSIVIPGQVASLGNPQRNADGRVRSFTQEAPPAGSATYSWNDLAAGTYLYHSGSHPAVQVQMGLYGALTKLEAANLAYPGVPGHSNEVTVLFSEIDVALHDAVATNGYGPGLAKSSTLHYWPQYFMINGVCYTNGMQANAAAHINAGVIPANGSAQRILVRMLNAGLDYRVPVLSEYHLDNLAEDGKLYPATRVLHSPTLPPLKTTDAFWLADTPGTFPIYDRRLGLASSSEGSAGMIAYLAIGRATLPSASFTWRAFGSAIPYPSTITVEGVPGVVNKVIVKINNLRHVRPQHLDMVLVSPDSRAVLFLSDVGGDTSTTANPINLTIDDAAPQSLTTAALVSGTYKPTNLAGATDTFSASATLPAAPYGTSLSTFVGSPANGPWRLFVMDNLSGPGNTPTTVGGTWNLIITPGL